MYYICALLHPSYVYGAAFFPDTSYERDERLIIGTVCYDKKVRLWMVNVGGDGAFISQDCLLELSIGDKPNIKMGGPIGIYEQEQLDDEALEFIVHPDKMTGKTLVKNNVTGKTTIQTNGAMGEYVHPNCMVFNENGRLFVGDSKG